MIPQYDGYQDDLNAPAAVQRPDGVIRAASIDIEFGDAGEGMLNTLYVQNTGTEELPAGFVIGGQSLFGEGDEVTPPPGSIDLVINGQIVTEAGTLTGIDVRDALVEAEGDITPFTENSTINGCLLVGPCEVIEPPESPFPPGFTPTPGIQDEVTLIDDGKLPPPVFGNEDIIDDNLETTADGANQPDRAAGAAVRHQRARGPGRHRRPGLRQRQPLADGNADSRMPGGRIPAGRPVQAGEAAMTRAIYGMLLASAALAPQLALCAARPTVDPVELPAGRRRRAVHRADQADRPAAHRHFRPRLSVDLP